MLQKILFGGLLAVGVMLVRRRANVQADVTAVTPGSPAVAHVALHYGLGRLPASLVIDVGSAAGRLGSATVEGGRRLIDIPLNGWKEEALTVSVETAD
ncbi:MAG TPA: hypothetical protein PKA05_15535 [Roseiflexaceae bacterium]|nr:hypothetical protein [Roseiflexaceae bacterium]HMP41791.1 hypothetical protein [Roseiflexaceae bacterium]